MRIDAILARESVGAASGAWVTFDRLCRAVAAAGHRVEVVTWPERPPPGPGGPAEAAQRLRESCAAFARQLGERWAAQRPDVVHLEWSGNVASAALDAALALGLPVSSTFHHMHLYAPPEKRSRVLRLMAGFHGRSHLTVAQSRSSREILQAAGGPAALVIHDAVDSERFHPRRRSAALRSAWGATDDVPVLFWAGRMVATKGLDALAAACAAVHAQQPAARIVLAGDGPEAAGLRAALPWAHFTGVLHGDDLAAAYASADVFCFSSPEEPWGNVLLEAAASGLAVVARSGAAAHEVLAPADACVLTGTIDPAELAAATVALVGDRERGRRLAANARAAVAALTPAAMAQAWLAAWDSIRPELNPGRRG